MLWQFEYVSEFKLFVAYYDYDAVFVTAVCKLFEKHCFTSFYDIAIGR